MRRRVQYRHADKIDVRIRDPAEWGADSPVSGDTQVGPLPINAARLAIVPAEPAQFLNITGRKQPINAAARAGMTDTAPVQQDCGPTSTTNSRLIPCHQRRPAQVRGTLPRRNALTRDYRHAALLVDATVELQRAHD